MKRVQSYSWQSGAALGIASVLVCSLPLLAAAGPLVELGQIQKEIARLNVEEQALAGRVGDLDRGLGEAESRLSKDGGGEKELTARLRRHLLALDRLGRTGTLAVLLFAPSLRDLHRRESMLRQAVHRERELLRRAADAHRSLRSATDDAARVRGEVAGELDKLKHTRLELDAKLQQRKSLLENMRTDDALARATAADLDAGALELRRQIDSHQQPGDRWEPLESRRGTLPLPAAGTLRLNFGGRRAPWLRTQVRHLGVDVSAPLGTPVTCVHPGVVVFVGSLVGYGEVVVVGHGQGYHTVYAQLQQIKVAEGAAVNAGAALGEVGPDPLDDPPNLHFELRHNGQAQDPKIWLGR